MHFSGEASTGRGRALGRSLTHTLVVALALPLALLLPLAHAKIKIINKNTSTTARIRNGETATVKQQASEPSERRDASVRTATETKINYIY